MDFNNLILLFDTNGKLAYYLGFSTLKLLINYNITSQQHDLD